MLDDHPIAEIFQFFRHFTLQLRQQLRADTRLIHHKILIFLGIGHPPDAIVLFYQLVAGHHLRLRNLFLRRKFVFDHFEYPIKGRQRKHQHHHAFHARRNNKLLLRLRHKIQVFTVAFGFTMLLAADRHIQFGGGFTRQDLPQPLDHRRWQRGIDHKVGAGEAKHDAGFGLAGQAGINEQRARLAVVDRQQERVNPVGHPQLTDQPGRLVTVEQLITNLKRRSR
ncbi:hypothetical protein D3C75_883400 [compost metagenome]